MSTIPKVTYWAGRGRCEQLRCIFAAAGVKFENDFLESREQMQQLVATGKLGYDQVPLVEIDGLNLVQSMPTAIYLAQKYGFWPEDAKGQYVSMAAFAAASDARTCCLQFPFHGDKDKLIAAADEPTGLWGRYCPKWERALEEAGTTFLVGGKASLGDIAVFEVLDFYRNICGPEASAEKLKSFPRVLALHDAVLALGSLKEWRDVERSRLFTQDWGDYARVVRQTLSKD